MTTNPDKPQRKHILRFAIFAVIILIIIVQTQYLMSVERTYCEGEVPVPGQQVSQAGPLNMKDAPDVLMLGAAWCPACKAATRFFVKNNINYCEYDMEKNALGARLYQEVNGRGVPILFIGEHRIHGFNAGTVTKALQNTGLL
jgi:glutaredoxin